MVMKLDCFGSGSFFRAFCIGLFCMGIAAAAGVFSVVRDARAARASKLG